jgi:hypothetical protein
MGAYHIHRKRQEGLYFLTAVAILCFVFRFFGKRNKFLHTKFDHMPRTPKLPIQVIFISTLCNVYETGRTHLSQRFARNITTPAQIHYRKPDESNSTQQLEDLLKGEFPPNAIVFDSELWEIFEPACKAIEKKVFYTFNGTTLWMVNSQGILEPVEPSSPVIIVSH